MREFRNLQKNFSIACFNPVTGLEDIVGVHVARAARIEPRTPTVQVYASETFAGILAEHGVTAFRSEYVGVVPLAKGYGNLVIYHVQRA